MSISLYYTTILDISIWMSNISDLTHPDMKQAFIFYTDHPKPDMFLYFSVSEKFYQASITQIISLEILFHFFLII